MEPSKEEMCLEHGMPLKYFNSSTNTLRCACCKARDLFYREIAHTKTIIINNIESANIPQRYRDKKLSDYKIQNDKQKQIVKSCYDLIKGKYQTGLIFSGKNGTGKTLLACMILKSLILQNTKENYGYNSYWYKYTEAIKIIRSIKSSWLLKTSEQEALNEYIDPRLLIIDEIGMQYGSKTEKQFLTEIINDRYNSKKQTILAGNATTQELKNILGDRVIDRFRESGRVLVFDWELYRKKGNNLDL